MSLRRIVIDPGHVGGTFFDLRLFEDGGEYFREGDFTFAWATVLKRELETRGVDITLTHERGVPSTLITNDRGRARADLLKGEIGIEAALRKFRVPRNFFPGMSDEGLLAAAVQNEADLIQRAQMAAELKADLCLSLHLNGDPNSIRSSVNGICAFTAERFLGHVPLFHAILKSVRRVAALQVYSYAHLPSLEEGLFIDETLTLMTNARVPTLLLEGPFQNNVCELPALRSDMRAFYERGVVEGRLRSLVDGVLGGLCIKAPF